MPIPTIIIYLLAAFALLSFGSFAILSIVENEPKAAKRAGAVAVFSSILLFALSFLPLSTQSIILLGFAALALIFVFLFFLPIGQVANPSPTPVKRHDEREIMFARARLAPDSDNYESYYLLHPEHQAGDELTRQKPGLLHPRSKYYHPLLFKAADASFFLTTALREAVDGPVAAEKTARAPQTYSQFIKDLCRYHGALDAGICKLAPYHIYTHIGRGSGTYGAAIELTHQFAIAFTVEMDYAMIGPNPTAPGIMESAKQYVEATKIAVQVAAAIRDLGYPARAHIDGNYRVIAPLVARDAGLGDIGRMGLLMTPKQGPRVRVGVVTTDLPLIPDPRSANPALLDFCTICKKCADCCPSQSISWDDREEIDGVLRWKINSDTCFRYWSTVGTDCGRCMTVCPYAHADNFMHNFIRWGIQHSGFFRRLAIRMDDFFYGKKPSPRKRPSWLKVE